MYSVNDDRVSSLPGFPIRTSPDQSLFSGSPKLFAAYHVLHRLPIPRHPPYALISLTISSLLLIICYVLPLRYRSLCCFLITKKQQSFLNLSVICNCQRTNKSINEFLGGGERDRTDDLLLARQALSQLSYTPEDIWWAREDLNLRPHDYQSCALAS